MKYEVGQVIEATVGHVTPFGAFVELEPPAEGLLHVSEIDPPPGHKPGTFLTSSVLKSGETRQFRVIDVNKKVGRVSLSLKNVQIEPPQE